MENFEQKLEDAKKLLEKLNDPNISLFDAMKFYKEGMKLLEEATDIIKKAKLEFEEISSGENK